MLSPLNPDMYKAVELSDLDLSHEAVDELVESAKEAIDVLNFRDFLYNLSDDTYDPDFVVSVISKSSLNNHITKSQADALDRYLNHLYSKNTAKNDPVFKYLAGIVFRALICYLEEETDRLRKTALLLERM